MEREFHKESIQIVRLSIYLFIYYFYLFIYFFIYLFFIYLFFYLFIYVLKKNRTKNFKNLPQPSKYMYLENVSPLFFLFYLFIFFLIDFLRLEILDKKA